MTDTQPQVAPEVIADKLTGLRDRYLHLTEQRATIDAELEEIKAAIRDTVTEPGTYDAGDGQVIVAANRRFDEKRALALIPEHAQALLTYPETRVRKDALRDLLPDVYEQAQVVYSERVTVK